MKNPFKKRDDPFAHNAWDGVIKSVRSKERKRPWLLRARWRWISALMAVLLAALAGYGIYLYYHLQGKVQTDIPEVAEAEDDKPFNVLLVGSDSREGLTEEEQQRLGADDVSAEGAVTGERADTLILAHVDPATNRVTMVQFPRDLYVPIAGTDQEAKINSALLDGQRPLVRTVEKLTGLEINHYAQVNIAGFRDIVDAIDGVKLCITEPIPFDTGTGIEVTEEELPVVEFDGERALRFVRARKVFASGDFARIQNQQKFLAAAISKVTSVGTFLDIGRIRKLYSAAGDNLKIDKGTSLTELYDISKRFRSFTPDKYEAYTAPNLGTGTSDAGESIVVPDVETMEVMFDALARNESPAEADGVPDIDVSTITVGVYNGTFEDGVASSAAEALKAATTIQGQTIEVVEVANADRFNYKRTVIRYDSSVEGAEEKAEFLAAAMPEAKMKEGKVRAGDVNVIVGSSEFVTKKLVQIVPLELPPPGTQPEQCRKELG